MKETKIGFCIPDFDPIRLKDFLSSNDAGKWGADPTGENDIAVVRSTNFNDTGYLDLSDVALRSLPEDDYKKTKLLENDIVIERSGGSANQPVGRVSFVTKEIEDTGFGFSNFIQRIRVSDEHNAKYVFYCLYHLHSAGITQTMQTQTNGIRNLEYRYYLNQKLPKPSPTEQTHIANFLSSVDKTIQASKNSIAKLEKLKTSLMQNLLTGKMKPDGTWRTEDEFWIDDKFGKVPNGWVVKFIGDEYVSQINPLYDYEINKEYDFLEMAAVENNFEGIKQYDKIFLSKKNSGYACFKNGDILFAKITPCTENGKIAIIENCSTEIGFGSTEFIVISPSSNINNYLLFSYLSLGNIHKRAVGLMEGTTGRQRVPWKIFKNVLQIAFPINPEEQLKIVEPLQSIDKNLKNRLTRLNHLHKLKKSLMQNLLTGKVRIPQEALKKEENEQ